VLEIISARLSCNQSRILELSCKQLRVRVSNVLQTSCNSCDGRRQESIEPYHKIFGAFVIFQATQVDRDGDVRLCIIYIYASRRWCNTDTKLSAYVQCMRGDKSYACMCRVPFCLEKRRPRVSKMREGFFVQAISIESMCHRWTLLKRCKTRKSRCSTTYPS
jgi:hypothetical protein